MKNKQIHFHEREFYMFSNFSSFSIETNNIIWQTSEHLYQATKFMDDDSKSEIVKEIQNASSAPDSKKIAKKYSDKIRKDWTDIKVKKMEEIIRKKHTQHSYIQKKLLETVGMEIIENSFKDAFWGWGPNKNGRNELGKIWMKIRDEKVKKT